MKNVVLNIASLKETSKPVVLDGEHTVTVTAAGVNSVGNIILMIRSDQGSSCIVLALGNPACAQQAAQQLLKLAELADIDLETEEDFETSDLVGTKFTAEFKSNKDFTNIKAFK